MMGVRMKLHETEIERVAKTRQVVDGAVKIGEKVADDVKAETSGSSTLRPYGTRMIVAETEAGATVGTDWGPAVPIEFGTIDTPAKRILLGAAERNAKRIEFS